MTAPRLTIVTNHPARAVLAVLGVNHAPRWCRIVTRRPDVLALPDGAKVIGSWFEPRKFRSDLEWAFIERREKGGLLGLSAEECDRLAAWSRGHGGVTALDTRMAGAVSGLVVSERRVG